MASWMGCDPHLDTFDVVVINNAGTEETWEHLANDPGGWQRAAALATDHGVEVVGIEAASGFGRHVAGSLLDAGVEVREIPTRLTGSMRKGDGGAKTDRGDARAIARLTARGEGSAWVRDHNDEAIRLLVHHRRALVQTQTREINELRALLAELDPARAAGLPRLRSRKGFDALARVAYTGDVHRDTAAGLIRRLAQQCRDRLDEIRRLEKDIEGLLPERAWRLIAQIPGVGIIVAATLIAEMAGTDGFATHAKMAAWAGTAPLDASSGRQLRHRLNRGGNRQANSAIHTIVLTQLACRGQAHTYITKRLNQGLTRKEAIRALKRHITRTIWKTLHLT